MNESYRKKRIAGLINTSVDDCRTSLSNESDPTLLCELLIACHMKRHTSREQVVQRRITQLIKSKS